MIAHEVIKEVLGTARFVMSSYLRDLRDDELLVQPVAGAHNAAWQLGHLIVSECKMADGVRAGSGIKLPEGFEAAHPKDATAGTMPRTYSKAEYEALMRDQRLKTLQLLDSLSAEALSAPAPEFMRAYAPHVGSVFASIAGHELMHSGQIAVIRRALGKPVVI